ncbi:hypothetical protein [Haliangium sp.]|uniref:hypothetical protein n=1 Tax=Haliangium sp. TaxID=2663208 RepID=UPI003D0EF44D
MRVVLTGLAITWALMCGCGGPQAAAENSDAVAAVDEGRGWQCAQVGDIERCARTKSRCLEIAVEYGADRVNCHYVESAVCLRYSEPAEDMQAWLCGRTAEDCRDIKELNLGPTRVMLRDCHLRH